MRELKVGDKLDPHIEENKFVEEVVGVCGLIIFTRRVFENGSFGPPLGPFDPDDFYTFGYTLIE